jgi:hypothetical protein
MVSQISERINTHVPDRETLTECSSLGPNFDVFHSLVAKEGWFS